jgi:transcriptional regulator with XRE-family HTH domain
MIQQPELGIKIATYRKAQGLTQEELVGKCNISVRTLQRIEAGDVTPRVSTVKLIFNALELEFDNSLISQSGDKNGLITKWLQQFHFHFIDLFNLKTNTMKKISILTVMTSALIMGVFIIANHSSAQNNIQLESKSPASSQTGPVADTSMSFSYFYSEESFYTQNELIARNTKFTTRGVTIASTLIKLNQDTGEFLTSVASGKLSENKATVSISKEMLAEMNYTADMIDKSPRKIHLRGNARINTDVDSFIESKEIIIKRN